MVLTTSPRKYPEQEKGQFTLFLDANGDGINDISGKKTAEKPVFKDEDGDGIDDNTAQIKQMNKSRQRGKDIFIDADGDGINDGRNFSQERRRGGEYGGGSSGDGSGSGNGGKQNRGNQ